MKRRLRITILVTMLAASCASVLAGQGTRPPHWSKDLSKYGYSAKHPYTDVAVAASADNIAVALNVNQNNSRYAINSDWKLSVLIFDANDGKLRATCGPWVGNIVTNLWSTSSENFLLYQGPPPTKPESSGRVLLLSPECQGLKKIELAPKKQRFALFFTSPTRRTFLIEDNSGRNAQLEVRDANTLYTRFKVSMHAEDPRVVAASDEGLLGVKPVRPGPSTGAPARFFYFDFHTQKWSEIPGPNAPGLGYFAKFLSNGNFIEVARTGRLGAWAPTGIRISIRGIDGTATFATVISRAHTHIHFGSPFAVSPTRNYFGAVLSPYGLTWAWLWRFFDEGPSSPEEVYIWSKQRETPLVHIRVRSGPMRQQLAFAPDGSWFALRSGKILMVRPLPRPPIPKP